MSRISNVKNVNNLICQECQQSQKSTMSNLPISVEICPDLLRFNQICQDPSRSVKIRPNQSRSYEICLIMSKCQPNCQNVNKIVRMSIKLSNVTISNVMCYQIVQIKLAHRLCTDFQYFSSIHNKMIHLFAFLVQYHTIQKLLLFIKDALLTSLRPVPLKNRKSMSSPAPQKLTKPVGCNEAKLIANTGGNYRKFSFRGGKMRKSISFRLLYSF